MKLAFILFDRPQYRGGPIVNMGRLLPALKARGHEILALADAPRDATTIGRLQTSHGITVIKYPTSIKDTRFRVRWILKQLRKFEPDVFIPNSFIQGFYAARWAREAGIPTIGYFRSDDLFHRDMINEFVFGEKRWALSGLACVAENLMKRVEERMPSRTHLFFLPSGVPVHDELADQRAPGFRVCYVGRYVEEQKQFRKTAEALFRNLKTGICTQVGFFGQGPEESWLNEEIRKRGLQDLAINHGSIEPEELATYLRDYHCSALLSDYEGTPGAVMDAMSSGLVPVTTRLRDGTSELVLDGVTGLQCDDRDDSFDRCLEQLSNDNVLRARLSDNARLRIQENYSISSTVERFEEFANILLDRVTTRRRKIRIPNRLNLPPTKASFAREDFRSAAFNILKSRVAQKVPSFAKKFLRAIIPN